MGGLRKPVDVIQEVIDRWDYRQKYPWTIGKSREVENDSKTILEYVVKELEIGKEEFRKKKYKDAYLRLEKIHQHLTENSRVLKTHLGRKRFDELENSVRREFFIAKAESICIDLEDVIETIKHFTTNPNLETSPLELKKKGEKLAEDFDDLCKEPTVRSYQIRCQHLTDQFISAISEIPDDEFKSGSISETLKDAFGQLSKKLRPKSSVEISLGKLLKDLEITLQQSYSEELTIKERIYKLQKTILHLEEIYEDIEQEEKLAEKTRSKIAEGKERVEELRNIDKITTLPDEIEYIRNRDQALREGDAFLWKIKSDLKEIENYQKDSDRYWELYEEIQNNILKLRALVEHFDISYISVELEKLEEVYEKLG
ncbi:MAG: hypothetical protein GF411_01190 [Candidatus Lokiarchaeota archaeon]|nr:hypothetical protein [Candidatus Lokiarchaeota archaeon]